MATLTFQDRTLHVIDRNGDKWLTVNDIAAALYPTNQGGLNLRPPLSVGCGCSTNVTPKSSATA